MSNAGFFGWLRESVRRSVLLGLSDAVEQLGAPADDAELHPQLAAMLRERSTAALEASPARRAENRPERKRLGRSLEQLRAPAIRPSTEPAAES